MPKLRESVYLLFIFCLAIWMGSGFHDTVTTNFGWYNDPVTFVETKISHPLPGTFNTWVISTLLLTVANLSAMLTFIRYTGKGRTEILLSITGILIMLAITFLYFVPNLMKIFASPKVYDNAALIRMSRQWVIFNFVRLGVVMILFIVGLKGLMKLAKA